MSVCRSQMLVEAPPSVIWELVGDPEHHPEWWPRVIEVRGQRFNQGDNYAQVTKSPMGEIETTMALERVDSLQAIDMRCQNTGTYARWRLTEAQGSTFIDVEFGMDPKGLRDRIFDSAFGRLYFRRWLAQSLAALEAAAARRSASPSA